VPFEATNTDLLQNSMYKRREHEIKCERDEIKCERDGGTDREQLSARRAKATVNEGGGRVVHPQVYLECWETSIFLICFLSDAPYRTPYLPVI
jgi:hypothetical protein